MRYFSHMQQASERARFSRDRYHTRTAVRTKILKKTYFALFARHVFKSVSLRTQLVLS